MVSKKVSKKSSMHGGVKVFNLYTTGIGDWGNRNYTLAHIWNDILLPKMIDILKASGFDTIRIHHYDPEIEWRENINMDEYYRNIYQILHYPQRRINNVNVTSYYLSHPMPLNPFRIREDPPIPFHKRAPHLIFDFAHLFRYKYIPYEQKSIPIIQNEEGITIGEYPLANSIYLGYLADDINEAIIHNSSKEAIRLRSLINSNFVKIDEAGNVRTYIDKISEYGLLEPILDIRNRQISRTISEENRTKLKRSTNRNAKTKRNFISSISIYNQPTRSENIIINYPNVTIRKIAELTYLDKITNNKTTPPKTMRNIRPFPENYINNLNTYFINTFMNQIML